MQRLFAISVVVVLFLNVFGFYIAFIVSQNEIRSEMMEKVAKENPAHLHLFSLSKEEYNHLKWTEKDKEFSYNGRVFDVSRIEYSNQYVQLYVEDDTTENRLIEDFVSQVNQRQRDEHNNSPFKSLLNNLFNVFTVPNKIFHFPFKFTMTPYQHKDTLYHSFISAKHSPPPDRMCS